MHPMLNIAVRAARAAGSIIVRHIDRLDSVGISQKSANDYVSDVDRMAERRIIEVLHKAYPSHAIVAEESGRRDGDEFQWVIDPLDGTTNFLHGFPHYAVSIALRHHGILEQGVVFDPVRQELFVASRGEGARLDDKRIRVSQRGGLSGALIGTGFPFRDLSQLERYLTLLERIIPPTAGIRRAGAASLDLAYVAAGRLDGFWEYGLSEWDLAAGALIIQEAGGMVSDPEGGDCYLSSGDIVAGSPRVHKEMLRTFDTAAHAAEGR